jgi:hypothetical protein
MREHAHEREEQALTNNATKNVDIATLPHDPWLSYDVCW